MWTGAVYSVYVCIGIYKSINSSIYSFPCKYKSGLGNIDCNSPYYYSSFRNIVRILPELLNKQKT